jgi:hypothetical protein
VHDIGVVLVQGAVNAAMVIAWKVEAMATLQQLTRLAAARTIGIDLYDKAA